MNQRIVFIIYNNQIHYAQNPNMDHRELYLSIVGNTDNYESSIRGFVMGDEIIFFKNNLSYDKDVINMACKCAPMIKQQLNNPYLKVCCGINPGQNGSAWEPILILNDSELTGFTSNNTIDIEKQKQMEEERQKRIAAKNESVIDFKNNFDDPKFIKAATIFTIIIFITAILSKILLFTSSKTIVDGVMILLSISQIILIIGTIIGYIKKKEYTKYIAIASSLSLVFMFNIFDIIIGIINLLFTIDQGYILKIITSGKNAIKPNNNNNNQA